MGNPKEPSCFIGWRDHAHLINAFMVHIHDFDAVTLPLHTLTGYRDRGAQVEHKAGQCLVIVFVLFWEFLQVE